MGKKKIVMKDIAREMNVSINTVSLALNHKDGLNEKTRSAIIAKAKEMGYELPVTQQTLTNNVILLMNKRYTKDFSFYSRVVYGITNSASQHRYNVLVDFFDNELQILPMAICNQSVKGILVAGQVSEQYLSLLQSTKLPLVLIDYTALHTVLNSVGTQNMQGAYTATEYLIKNGHRKIGFIGDICYSPSLQERWLGFRTCIEQYVAQGVYQDYHNISIIGSVSAEIIRHDYQNLAKKLESLPEFPSAFVCCNDETAICTHHAVSLLGYQTGKDVSLIGFDDIENAKRQTPPLTTMHIHKRQMGETAFLRLLDLIENPELAPQNISLPVELVERDSVLRIAL